MHVVGFPNPGSRVTRVASQKSAFELLRVTGNFSMINDKHLNQNSEDLHQKVGNL